MDKKYLIDSNIFITAHRALYPFDIAPGFWEQLIERASNKIIIIEKVHDEIVRGADQLTNWYMQNNDRFNVLTIPETPVIQAYSRIISDINDNEQYKQTAKDGFATSADSWLCAYGLAYNYTIVTREKYRKNAKNRVLIPNICLEFDIKYIDLLQFMRETGFKL